jgi:GxxExxY protein
MDSINIRKSNLVYLELSYKIVGILFSVFNGIGGQHYEKNIQRAIEIKLRESAIEYRRELVSPIRLNGKRVGQYRFDFLIEEKIILEIKRGRRFVPCHFKQLKTYISAHNIPLGILAIFTESEVKFARVVNFSVC